MRSLRSNVYSRMSRPKKFLWISITVFVVVIIGLAFFYASVQKDYFADRDKASQIAKEQLGLRTVTRVESSYGDEAYHIVFGTDNSDRPIVAWVSDTIFFSEFAEGAIQEAEVRAKVLQLEPSAKFLRVIPNRVQNVNVWEAYYKKVDENGDPSYYYTYYRFSDGEYIDTYKLSA